MRSCSPKTYEQFHTNYQMLQQLGVGKFGKVYSVRHKITHQSYAVKVISCNSQRDIQEAQQEIQIIEQLDHPNIVKIQQYYRQDYVQSSYQPLCNYSIVIDMGIYSLYEALLDRHYHYDLSDVRRFLANLIKTGAYLESQQLVHRDIKPGNIIIFGPHLEFKLADFGLSCKANQRPNGFAGTPQYCSPLLKEFYLSKIANRRPISDPYKDDVYSVGVTAKEILKGLKKDILKQARNNLLQGLNFIIDQMMEKNEKDRPTFSDLMRSDFIHQQLQLPRPIHTKNITIRENILETERKQLATVVRNIVPEEIGFLQNPTMMQKATYNISSYFYEVEYSIRAICRINHHYILCGDEEGKIIVFDCFLKQSYVLSVNHQTYVARIILDETGNVWTAGGDGLIYLFHRANLIDCIKNKRVKNNRPKSCLYVEQYTQKIVVKIEEEDYKVVHRGPQGKFIITFACFTPTQYVVAYADGNVYVQWNGKQKTYQNLGLDIVTNIQIVCDKVYTSFYNGTVTSFDLRTFTKDKTMFQFNDKVINFKVQQSKDIIHIEAVTHSGNIQTIKINQANSYSFYEQMTLNGILGACYYQNMWFILSKEGKICPRGRQIIQSPRGDGWNCLQASNDCLVGCSFEGMLVVLQFQLA